MDQTWLNAFALCAIIPLLILFLKIQSLQHKKDNKHKILPPSPPSLPILGHLHLLKNPIIHHTLQHLSLQYGSIYSLKVGSFPFVVISSPSAVEECFTINDIVLANRPKTLLGKYLHYEWTTLGSVSYGPLFQNLRRVTTLEMFSTSRMNAFAGIRLGEVRSLVKGLFGSSKENFCRVEMRPKLSGLSLNILTRVLTGKKYSFFGDENEGNNNNNREEADKFLKLIREIFELSGVSSLVDCLPFLLRWISFRNVEERMVVAKERMDSFLNDLIEDCRRKRRENGCDQTNEEKSASVIYKLLDLQELDPSSYSDIFIKGIILVMLIAGTDTSGVTMEWALSLLLNHPKVFQKAREEIDNYKGNDELVEEADLPNLPYLQCIINETLRLFPAAPTLIAHQASEDITISGYHIEKGQNILINAWAIHRDPNLWDEPLEFRPERFEGLKSEDYRYSWIPFGLGRRSCPGATLANRVVGLALANLIQCFEWERVDDKDVDLDEGIGLTMPKAKPLEAMCKPRSSMINVLSKM